VARTLPILAAGAVALTAASMAVAAPQRPATSRQAAPIRQLAQNGAKQPVVPGFYDGKTVRYFNYGPIKLRPGNQLAPIWTFTNGAAGQHNIIDVVPGEKGYTPLWQVIKVTWAAGKTPRVLRSADDVKKAETDGEVTLATTSTVVNCPVLGFGQKRVAGFSGGHVIHYYDLGPVKVAPGNTVVPLYTVTNGGNGQNNITGDTLAPGQTAYPPLWGIVKVTWKAGAQKRLLTSFAAIQKAKAAGEVTLAKTSLVVNCPIVP
jgi:hypothetical protein